MAKINTRREILVYASWRELKDSELLGFLYAEVVRGKENVLNIPAQ
jgi:hypothetical protein